MKKSHFGHNLSNKYSKIFRYNGVGGYGAKRVFDTIMQVDLFDWVHGTKTSEYKTEGYTYKQYMFYAPAYTSVVREMLRVSVNYYTSAIKYTDYTRREVFLDLGCGAGKVVLMASKSAYFDHCFGVELDKGLVELATNNIKKVNNSSIILGNAERPDCFNTIIRSLKDKEIDPVATTIFVFNKNSYGADVLKNSLEILRQYFSSIVYLYQNPVHAKVIEDQGFYKCLMDGASNVAHKNWKYNIYIYQEN
jgi:SAM-dependent methyltransferase